MTKKQAIGFLILGVVVAAVLLVAHLLMPFPGSWTLNRILHHVWEWLAVLAAAGGIVWLMWPRPKPRRRDEHREQARRRFIALVATVLAAVILVRDPMVFASVNILGTRNMLKGAAEAWRSAVSVPLYPALTDREVEMVVRVVGGTLAG